MITRNLLINFRNKLAFLRCPIIFDGLSKLFLNGNILPVSIFHVFILLMYFAWPLCFHHFVGLKLDLGGEHRAMSECGVWKILSDRLQLWFFSLFSQLAITFRKALDISITAAQPIFEEANHFQNITSFIYTDNAMIVAILVLYTSMTALEHTSVNWRMTLIFLYTHFLLLLSLV